VRLPTRGAARSSAPLRQAGLPRPTDDGARSSSWATVGALAVLLFATVGLLARHVVRGNFYTDDWALAAIFRSEGGRSHPLHVLHRFLDAAPGRPVLGVYLAAVYNAFGTNPHLHLAWTAALTVLVVFGVFATLRTLSFSILDSFAVAFLVLVSPFADSTKLWNAAGVIQLALAFYLLGLILGLRALQATGRRAWTLHAVSLVLYAFSVMDYESTFGLIFFSLALYYTKRRDRFTTAIVVVNGVVMAAVLLGVSARTNKAVHGVGSDLHHGRIIVSQSFDLLGRVLFPWGPSFGHVALVLILVIVSSCGVLFLVAGWGDTHFRRRLVLGLALTGGGVLAVVAAYLPYLPADDYYSPYGTESLNRVNAGATLGYALLVYGLILTVALLLVRTPMRVLAVSTIGVGIVASGYIGLLRSDAALWDRAAAGESRVLDVLMRSVPQIRPTTIIYLWGSRSQLTSQLPIFSSTWDLPNALRLRTNDFGVVAFPMLTTTGFFCGQGFMYPTNGLYDRTDGTRYRDAFFVDFESARAFPVHDQATCRQLVARFSTPRIVLTSSSNLIQQGQTVRIEALITRGEDPLIAVPVDLTLGTGSEAQRCAATTLPDGRAICVLGAPSTMLGQEPVVAEFAGNDVLRPARASIVVQVNAPSGG
jgi:hypothetical protein